MEQVGTTAASRWSSKFVHQIN